MRKQHKAADGKYHIGDKVFQVLVGTRAQVYHGTAYKTSGGLLKKDLVQNKRGRIVSKKKLETAKRERRLEKHGYFAEKGKFGAVRKTAKKFVKRTRRRPHTRGGRTLKR
jgi:hypothetical protein